MKSCKVIFLLLLLVGGICSCAHQPPVAKSPAQHAKFVAVGSIANDADGHQAASQIATALEKAGIIDYVISGSSRLDIMVRADQQAEVARLLKQDAQIHKYEITFY